MDDYSLAEDSNSFDNYQSRSPFRDQREQTLPEDGVAFIGLRSSDLRTVIYWFLVLGTAGIFFLAAKILPYLQAKIRFVMCTLEEADRVLVRRYDEGTAVYEIAKVHVIGNVKWLEYMYYRYLWKVDPETKVARWEKLKYALGEKSFNQIYSSLATGITTVKAHERLEKYGANSLAVPVPSYFKLFYTEVVHPFYLFQVASIIIWLNDNYWIYASCIFVMAVFSAVYSTYQARKNREMLAEMCYHESVVRVLRKRTNGVASSSDGMEYIQVSSREIAPGDLVEIRADMDLPCDLLLVRGQCVVNESALTGESVPVAKSSIPSQETDIFHQDVHGAKHLLYNGTHVLQTRADQFNFKVAASSAGYASSASDIDQQQTQVLGLAVSTGFATAKGDLIRSIMFPRPTRFKFYRDSMRFIGVLFMISLLGFVYTIAIFTHYGSPVGSMVKRALDLITITVPPALPIAMSIATAFSIRRLRLQSIFCTSPQRVNVSGRIDVMCFDKTGTLTEDHLDVHGIVPALSSRASSKATFEPFLQDLSSSPPDLLQALACCHSLNMLHGNLIGDPLEIKMFEATQWSLVDSGQVRSPDILTSIATLKFFEFSSLLQRMSVITETIHLGTADNAPQLRVYAKGAPEVIKSLCDPSTVPKSFDNELSTFTQQGKRVLALAKKDLAVTKENASKLTRAEAETHLTFLGLFVLQNQLKEDTTEAILNITGGNVANVMVTGDNEFTAINVARQCGILAEDDKTGDASVYLITLRYDNDLPMGLFYSYIPGIDPNGPDAESRRHTIIDLHASSSSNEMVRDSSDTSLLRQSYASNGDSKFVEMDVLPSSRRTTQDPKPVTSIDDIPHSNIAFAVHGKAFEFIRTNDRQLFARILKKGSVYARMSPLDKTHLIEGLQTLGHTVGMCGDGANDVGALKAADVGLSLSEAEASVAAPFTSKVPSIHSMWTLLREGRCALASSIACYKYMAVYSMIQLVSCLILYAIWWDSRLTDPQFLWIDIFLVFPLSFLMGRTEPRPELSSRKPPGALVSLAVVGSVIIQTIYHFLTQLGFFLFLTKYYWPNYHPEWTLEQSMYMRVGALFMFANFQYIGACLAYSISKPWRKSFWTNLPFAASLMLLFIANVYMVVYPAKWVSYVLSLGLNEDYAQLEPWLKFVLIASALVEIGGAWLLERVFVIAWIQPYEEQQHKLQPLEHWADDPSILLLSHDS